ncbi:MAG TPA: TonB-dependent receptor [Burkholderiaceae bacterium]|jgi:TonB-dependent receptor
MRQLRPALRLTQLAAASGLLFAGAAAQAQDAATAPAPAAQQLDTVVVTGIRASIESSVNLKRNAHGVVDGIVAEDIGKFPDTNLAEAMQRISGVSIDRANGEGTKITVRGMGPDFNLVLLNGRQMPGSNIDGSAPSSRSFDFSNLAAEGVSALEVYKTSRASSPTGGMGATINIRTPRPFDSKATIASFGVKLVKDQSAQNLPPPEQGKKETPEVSGIYSTQMADGKFGIALIGSYQVRDSGYNQAAVTSGWHTFKGSDSGWGPLPIPAPEVKNRPGPNDIYNVPQNLDYAFTGVHRERLNGQLVLQARPMQDMVATLDYTMSEQKFRQTRNDISAWFNFGGQFGEYTSGPIATPLVYGEHMTNADVAMGASRVKTKNKNQSLGLNLTWKATNALSFDLDAHHSTAVSGADDPLGTNVTMGTASLNRGDTSVDFSQKFPVLSILNAPLNPALQELQGTVFGNSLQRDQINQLQLRSNWKIDDDSNLNFGVNLTDVRNRSAFANVQRDTWGANAAGGPAAMPDDIWHADSISKYFSNIPGSGNSSLYNQFFYFNFDDLRNAAIKYLGSDALLKASFNFQNDFHTREKSQALYAEYNRQWDWGIPIEASIGGRYERTKVLSPSQESIPTAVTWVSANELPVTFNGTTASSRSGKYGYFLPSLDLSADVTMNTKLRFSYGSTIGRPGWAAIQGGETLDALARINGGTGSVGNPDLKPLKSNNFDFSAEHYYDKGSYISAGYFHKSITNYIQSTVLPATPFSLHTPVGGAMYNAAVSQGGCALSDSGCIRAYIFANYPNAPGVNVAGQTIAGQSADPVLIFQMSTQTNSSSKASLNGIELNAQHTFRNGFGGSVNYTRVRSGLTYNDAVPGAQSSALVGLGDSGNIVAFYEDKTISTRVAYNWRGKFLSANYGGTDGAQPQYTEPYGQWDLSVGYNFDQHLSFQFEAINLTNEYTRTHMRAEQQVGAVTELGRRFMIGARYKF